MKSESSRPMQSMKVAGVAFCATWLLHTADHIRRTTEQTSDGVIWAGTSAAVIAAAALTLIFTDHPLAPFAATAAFMSIGFGTMATHLAPGWGYFSEPLVFESAADGWAALASIPEIVAALWLGLLGLQALRANNFQIRTPELA